MRAAEEERHTALVRAIRANAPRRRAWQAIGVAVVAGLTAFGITAFPAVMDDLRDDQPARHVGTFVVTRLEFTVGAAGGFAPVSYETGRHRHRVRLVPDAGGGSATVDFHPAGRLPRPEGERAPDVDRDPAVWLDEPDRTSLAWEWFPDSWAFVHVDATGADARDRAHQVARSVEVGPGSAVSLPFTVPEPLSDGPQLVGVIFPYGPSADPAAGGLVVFGGSDDLDERDRLFLGVRRDLTSDFVTGEPRDAPVADRELLAGQVAAVTSTSATILDIGGGYAAVAETETPSETEADLIMRAGAVVLVENPADPRAWTTDPLR